MTIQVNWADKDKTILRLYYEQIWGWQDAIDGHIKANQMMAKVKHPVAIILDLSDSDYIPPGSLAKVRELSFMRGQQPNDSGITVFLNADILTKAVVEFVDMTESEELPELQAVFSKSLDDAIQQAQKALQKYNSDL